MLTLIKLRLYNKNITQESFVSDRPDRLDEASSGQVQSLVRAFAILDALVLAGRPMGLREIADSVGLARSTCHRLLTTMQAISYVRFDMKAKHWLVGRRSVALSQSFIATRDLASMCQPFMKSLAMGLGETINLSVLDGANLRYLTQASSKTAMGTFARPGAEIPAHCTAAGKSIMAFLPEDHQEQALGQLRLEPKTNNTIVEMPAFMAELHQTKQRGFGVDLQENCTGIVCVAVPIFDESGVPKAAVSMSSWANRLSEQGMISVAGRLRETATEMSREIGGLIESHKLALHAA
jgi:IclR family transcriptional regulator, acetate operon repressor